MGFKWDKGQSTIEYIIVVSVIIAGVLLFASQGGLFQTALNSTIDQNLNAMVDMANAIFDR